MAPERRRSSRKVDVAVIGLGNWGTSLAAGLAAARIPLPEIVVRTQSRRTRRRKSVSTLASVVSAPLVSWTEATLDASILWICVPDAAIAEVAERIAAKRRNLRGQIVVHSSGALTADVLDPVRLAGAGVASVHPVMTFPATDAVPLQGMLFGVESSDAETRRKLYSLVRKLGGRPFKLISEKKALYHAAGTLASPLLVSELGAAIEAARMAGLDSRTATLWVKSLAEATASNVFAHGPVRSFSGPFARGDAGTIRLHLQALDAHPILAGVYRSLASYAVSSLPVRNLKLLNEILNDNTGGKPNRSRNAGEQGRRGARVRD
jgi:predicted short-subunit dehydrogenase-like oxidoreductase (DUF2520 family)